MCLAPDREALLTFFAFPAEHWIHLRTTNVIESPFATVRLRQRVTKGAGSRTKGLLMAYKLLDADSGGLLAVFVVYRHLLSPRFGRPIHPVGLKL